MITKYTASGFSSSSQFETVISVEELEAISQAHRTINQLRDFDDKIGFVIENYLDLEKQMFDISHRYMFEQGLDVTSFQSDRFAINHKIINLLSSCRLYWDQMEHEISQLEQEGLLESFRVSKSKEYDAKLGFRVLETLRNHVQHRGLPVEIVTYAEQAVWIEEKQYLERRISPTIKIQNLKEGSKIKSSVMTEIEDAGLETLPLLEYIRDYIESTFEVHCKFREQIESFVEGQKGFLESFIERMKSESGFLTSKHFISITTSGSEGEILDRFTICGSMLEFEEKYFKGNRGRLSNFKQSFVSNRI